VAQLRAAADGEEPGIGAFVDAYWPRMHRIAALITAGGPEAEDIAQESVLRALAALPELDLERAIEPWLDRVTANASRDWLRKQARRQEVLLDQVADEEEDPGWPAVLDAGQLAEEVVHALAELSAEERTVVVLRHALDFRGTEIAELLGVPDGTVRSLNHRALKKLRKQLKPEEVADAR